MSLGNGKQFNDNFLIKVQKGQIPGHSIISKFGENPDIDSDVAEDIWDYEAADLYTFSTSAIIDSISSSNNSDTQVIVVQGLDENWEEVTQIKTLTGQARAVLDTPLIRLNRAFSAGTVDLLGNVYIYENTAAPSGIPTDPTKVRGYISLAEQQTLQGIYTIPAGKTGYFLGFSSSMSKPVASSNAILTGKVRPFGSVFRTQLRFALISDGNSHVNVEPQAFSAFPEKADFVAHADVTANNTGVSIIFNLLLVDNEIG